MVATVLVAPAAGDTLDCGDVITTDVRLTRDVGPCEGEGLLVAGDDITVDFGGRTVTGTPGARPDGEAGPQGRDRAGILLRQVHGVKLMNGTVTGFDAGVVVAGGGDHTIRRVTARDNVNYRLVTGRDALPGDIDPQEGPFCWFGDGITTFNSSGNVITQNTLVGNGPFSGVSLVGNSDDNVVTNVRSPTTTG